MNPVTPQRIVFLDRATLAPQVLLRAPYFAHELIAHDDTAPAQVAERLAGATIAITNKVSITAEAPERLPLLRPVAVAATGTDCVDKAACAARGWSAASTRPMREHCRWGSPSGSGPSSSTCRTCPKTPPSGCRWLGQVYRAASGRLTRSAARTRTRFVHDGTRTGVPEA